MVNDKEDKREAGVADDTKQLSDGSVNPEAQASTTATIDSFAVDLADIMKSHTDIARKYNVDRNIVKVCRFGFMYGITKQGI